MNSRYRAFTTDYGKGTTSRSSLSIGHPDKRTSRTAPAAKSPASTSTGPSRLRSTDQDADYKSTGTTPSRYGSPTPNTFTANRARPSINQSCSPAAGKPAARPPMSKPPVPAMAPTGIWHATSSAKKDKTLTGSQASHDK